MTQEALEGGDFALPPAPRRRGRRRLKLGIVVVLLAAGVVYLAVIAARSGTAYYVTPSELLRDSTPSTNYRLGGRVLPGSIEWREGAVHFLLADGDESPSMTIIAGGASIPVTYSGVTPDLFAELAFVVVDGTYSSGTGFTAKSLVVKHESEFLSERKKALED